MELLGIRFGFDHDEDDYYYDYRDERERDRGNCGTKERYAALKPPKVKKLLYGNPAWWKIYPERYGIKPKIRLLIC